MRKKIVNSLITATVIGSMLTGMAVPCFAGEKKDDGSSITVLVESGSPAEALANNTAADFEKETGCKVVVDAVAYTGMYDKLSTEIKAGQAAHDVSCMDFVWLAAFADAIEPITDADTSDFLPTLEESGTVDGNLLGYPMWVNAKILIYRKDLIPEDKVPKTWDEYKALAKEMKTDDMYGTTVFGSGSDAVCSFLDFACQAGADGLVYDKDGNVNITDQPYVDALDFMVEMANEDCTPSDSLATASTESQELFNNGKVAMQLNWSHQYPAAVEALGADKVGCAPMIAGSAGAGATTGPWYECVMKNSENKDMALKYVEYMYDHNADYMNGTLKIAGRTSVYEEAGKEAGVKLIYRALSMKEAVEQGYKLAETGDIVLLSPACSSFDWYSCFEERGDDFKLAIRKAGNDFAVLNDEWFGIGNFDFQAANRRFGKVLKIVAEEAF